MFRSLRVRRVNRSVVKTPGNLLLRGPVGLAESAIRTGTGGGDDRHTHIRPLTLMITYPAFSLSFWYYLFIILRHSAPVSVSD